MSGVVMHDYLLALSGGLLLGISALMLMIFGGRIAGISGIFSGALFPEQGKWLWRVLFLLGMLLAPAVLSGAGFSGAAELPPLAVTEPAALLLAGLLVGVGTAIGSGCTSGHGICGIGRLAPRSIVATCTFMAVAVLTVLLLG